MKKQKNAGKAEATITVSLSPNTAYMKAGEEIYLSVNYLLQKSPDFSAQLITWNQKNVDQAQPRSQTKGSRIIAEN